LVVSTSANETSASTTPMSHDLLDGDAAAGERALRGALNVAVNVLVGDSR
jgi:hypothetical protein